MVKHGVPRWGAAWTITAAAALKTWCAPPAADLPPLPRPPETLQPPNCRHLMRAQNYWISVKSMWGTQRDAPAPPESSLKSFLNSRPPGLDALQDRDRLPRWRYRVALGKRFQLLSERQNVQVLTRPHNQTHRREFWLLSPTGLNEQNDSKRFHANDLQSSGMKPYWEEGGRETWDRKEDIGPDPQSDCPAFTHTTSMQIAPKTVFYP